MWKYNYTDELDELYHHGVKGQRWGFRRYQNKDGSLTPAGRRRANKLKSQYEKITGRPLTQKSIKPVKSTNQDQNKKKTVKEMSDDELRERTNRMRLENEYATAAKAMKDLEKEDVTRGKKIVDKVLSDIVAPVATDVTRQLVKSYVVKGVNDGLKLEKEYKIYTNNKKKN